MLSQLANDCTINYLIIEVLGSEGRPLLNQGLAYGGYPVGPNRIDPRVVIGDVLAGEQ